MLHPYAQHKDLNADQLREIVTLRDQSIQISKVKNITLSGVNREVVTIDDNPTPQSMKVVSKYLKAPSSFLSQADLPLAQHIVDHQLKKVKDEVEVVFRDGKAIGDQPAGSIRLSGAQIVDKMIAAAGAMRRGNFYDLGNYIDVSLCGDKVTMKPKLNDITEGGLRCLYSEIMTRPPTLEPYVERLVCLNGMIMKDRMQTFKFATLDQFMLQFDRSANEAMAYVDSAIRAQLTKAAETKVERGEQALRTIFENQNLNSRLLSPALAALAVEEDGSAFGVLQAITRAANTQSYSRRLTMQEVGAKEMARLETVHCPTCWSSLVH